MVYLLHGEDDFSRSQFVTGLKQGLVSNDSGLLPANLTLLAGNDLALPQLVQVCDAYPFLAEKRMVIVEGLLSRFERRPGARESSRTERRSKDLEEWRKALAEYVPHMPPSTILAFVEGKLNRDNPLLQALSPLAEVKVFAPLRQEALVRWIEDRVRQGSGSIAPQATALLAETVGPNLWALASEVDKLLTYCQGRPIAAQDVQRLVAQTKEITVFAFVDAVVEGQPAKALLLLHRLFLEGAGGPQLVAMVARQLHYLLKAKEMLAQHLPYQSIGQRLGLFNYPLQKTIEQAGRVPEARLLDLYDRLLDLDLAIKTGRSPEEIAWELFVAVGVRR